MLTTTELYDAQALAALIADATALGADLKAGLYTNTPTITKQMVIADLTEPTYAGYVRQSVLMAPPSRDPQNGIVSVGAALIWQEGGLITPETIRGIFYTYGAGPLLLGVEPFAVSQNLVDALSAFTTVLQYIQSSENAALTTIIV
jgi:hypothetical protein